MRISLSSTRTPPSLIASPRSKITIPQNSAGLAAKLLLARALGGEKAAGKYDDLRDRAAKEATIALQGFDAETVGELEKLADEIANARGAIILYDEMATLAPDCADLAADLQALAVVTENIDRPGSGAGPLFEDANSLGARDMGLLPDALPGYRPAEEPGLAYDEMLKSGDMRALLVMGANPLRHAELPPNLEFLVVQDITLTETARRADVVLPAVSFAEKDGSMTNVDHHVQAVRRALRPLPGAKADWEILIALANHLGQKWTYSGPRDVFAEIAANNPFYRGLTWEDLGTQGVRTREQEVTHA